VLSEAKNEPMTNWPGVMLLTSLPTLLDDAAVFVADRGGLVYGVDAAVVTQVRTAHAGGGQAENRVAGVGDLRVVALFEADVSWRVQNCAVHGGPFPE